jgi:hypothetical protein
MVTNGTFVVAFMGCFRWLQNMSSSLMINIVTSIVESLYLLISRKGKSLSKC